MTITDRTLKLIFSQKEMKIIKDNLNGSWIMSKYGLSERESKEFLLKLKGVE